MNVTIQVKPFSSDDYQSLVDIVIYHGGIEAWFDMLHESAEPDHEEVILNVALMDDTGDEVLEDYSTTIGLGKLDQAIVQRALIKGCHEYNYGNQEVVIDFGQFDCWDAGWILQMAAFDDVVIG